MEQPNNSNPVASSSAISLDLYKAVIGPKNQATYLHHFSEFDAQGKTGLRWHWAAFFSMLNWLLFRGMWGVTLVYVGVMLILGLGILGISKLVFDASTESALLLFAGFILLASIVCGLYAHALYYRFCKNKIIQAVTLSSNLREVRKLLQDQASSDWHFYILASLNAAVGALVLWVASLVAPALEAASHQNQNAEKETPAAPASPASPAIAASLPEASASTPESVASTPALAASAAVAPASSAASAPVVEMAASGASEPTLPASAPQLASSEISATPVAPKAPASATKQRATPAKRVSASQPTATTTEASATSDDVATTPTRTDRYYLQVGVFAVEENANKLQERLQGAGFTVTTPSFTTSAGTRVQVRVGPFSSKQEAADQAVKLQELGIASYILQLKP